MTLVSVQDYELRFSDFVVMVNINSILKKGGVTKAWVPNAPSKSAYIFK